MLFHWGWSAATTLCAMGDAVDDELHPSWDEAHPYWSQYIEGELPNEHPLEVQNMALGLLIFPAATSAWGEFDTTRRFTFLNVGF